MTQKSLSTDTAGEKSSADAGILGQAGAGLAALGDGLGAIYAAFARLALTSVESLSDRRAENRAAHLRRGAKAFRARKTDRAAAKDNS